MFEFRCEKAGTATRASCQPHRGRLELVEDIKKELGEGMDEKVAANAECQRLWETLEPYWTNQERSIKHYKQMSALTKVLALPFLQNEQC